jgi:hypothetical protein
MTLADKIAAERNGPSIWDRTVTLGEIADTIDAAADEIRFSGHWRGDRSDGGACVIVALARVTNRNSDDGVLRNECADRLYRDCAIPSGFVSVPDWSDATDTDDLLDQMNRYAMALREVVS